MSMAGLDMVSAAGAVIATVGVVGPGFGTVGPVENYAHIVPFGKSVLILCMLLGRLELFTVLVLFFPSFWRKRMDHLAAQIANLIIPFFSLRKKRNGWS